MVTRRQVPDVLELSLKQHGPDTRPLARAVAELVPLDHQAEAFDYVYETIRTMMWPPPACACGLAGVAWRALPEEAREHLAVR